MRVIRTLRGLQTWRRRMAGTKQAIGFVPTMGALHEGHVSLMRRARKDCDLVLVSIFVNPLQFGPAEDLRRYPRTCRADRNACQQAGVDLIFFPRTPDLFPDAFQTSVVVDRLTKRWEGEMRPTHFQGVTTVVTKLLNLVAPHRAYFGQKDYQQYVVIKQLVEDLNLPVKIIRCPTVREADGLAMSSRNRYLGKKDRELAAVLYQALSAGAKAIKMGERSTRKVQQIMACFCTKHPELSVDYLAICHPATLEPLQRVDGDTVLLGAARIGKVRLIDNIPVRGA